MTTNSFRRLGRFTSLVLFLSLCGFHLYEAPAASAKEIKEPSSGVAFPVVRKWGKYKMKCLGTALREKFSFDVYAGCFYVDIEEGKKKLEAFLATPEADGALKDGKLDKQKLLKNEKFYQWLINADLPISIDMTFVRDVPADKIRETYREGLILYMKDMKVMSKFVNLSQGELKKWDHLTLNIFPGGRVVFQFAGKTHPPIDSTDLAKGLLSIYFGKKPISDEIKQSLVKHIDWLLK